MLKDENEQLVEQIRSLREQQRQQMMQGLTVDIKQAMDSELRELRDRVMTQRDEIATRAASEAAGRDGERKAKDEAAEAKAKRQALERRTAELTERNRALEARLDALAGAETKMLEDKRALARLRQEQDAEFDKRLAEAVEEAQKGMLEATHRHREEVDRLKDEHTLRIASLQTGVERAAALESELRRAKAGEAAARSGSKQASSKLIEAHDLEMRLRAQLTDALATAESARAEVVTLRANEGPAHSALGVLQHKFEALTREKQSQEESLRREVVTLRARCETLEREHREATRTAQHKVAEAEAARAAALYGAQRTEERLTSAEASRHATEQVSHFFWGIVVS
jgi:hypothetical protein